MTARKSPRPKAARMKRFTVHWNGGQIWSVDAADEHEALRIACEVTCMLDTALEIREAGK